MQLFIKASSGQFTLPFDESTTVGGLKSQIFEQLHIPNVDQRLIYAGKQFSADDQTISEYGVEDLHTIHLLLRLRGGGTAAVVGPAAAVASAGALIADAAGVVGLAAGTTAATAGAGGVVTGLVAAQSAAVATMAAATPFGWLIAGTALVSGAIIVAGKEGCANPVCWRSILNSGELDQEKHDFHGDHGILIEQVIDHCELFKAENDERLIVKNQKDEYFAFSISSVIPDTSDHHIDKVTVVHAVPVQLVA